MDIFVAEKLRDAAYHFKKNSQVSSTQQLDSRCADFSNVGANATFWGVRTQGAMIPTFELGRDFCIMHLYTPKFYHHRFTRLEVIVSTNKFQSNLVCRFSLPTSFDDATGSDLRACACNLTSGF